MRQLSLFKGKRQRGLKAPPPLEFHDHCFLADILKRWLMPGWRYTHLPLGELRDKVTAIRLHRMGVTPGWPDFMFVGPKRSMFFLELKRRGGRLSEEQIDVGAHINACGFPHFVTTDVRSAIGELKAQGILRSSIEVQ